MNPEAINVEKNGLYKKDIALKMKDFSLIMAITMAVCGVLSQALMFPMDNVVSTDNNQVVVEENDKKNDVKESYASNEIYNNEGEAPLPTDNNDQPEITNNEEKKSI